jgi:hypothetical protein
VLAYLGTSTSRTFRPLKHFCRAGECPRQASGLAGWPNTRINPQSMDAEYYSPRRLSPEAAGTKPYGFAAGRLTG